ncbi:MAG: RNA polymerase sigma factor [Pyrinomonadaceae bacterium]
MDNPILSKLQTSPGDPPTNGSGGAFDREGFFAESLKLIRKVIAGRRSVLTDDVPDISQETALRLWKWLKKYPEKSNGMSAEEWKSFTARSAYNEISRRRTKLIKQNEVPLEDVPSIQDLTRDFETDVEMTILVCEVWQGICKLSLYQRRALLFHSADLLIYLMQFRIDEKHIAEALSLEVEEWRILSLQMPLTDIEIAKLISGSSKITNTDSAVRNIKKARHDARKKLGKLKR